MPDEMSTWVTVEIGVRLPEGADAQVEGERALHDIEALIGRGVLPPVTLTVDGLLVRRGSPGDRWVAFTDDELEALAARTVDQHPQEYDWPVHALYVEVSDELERRRS